jgi:queuosine precursor transporter
VELTSRTQHSTWFVVLVAVFVTCLLVANIIAVKLVSLFGLLLPAGIVIFPLSYICGDVLTEVYGYRRARQVIWIGFACNVVAICAIWIAQILPSATIWDGQQAYERILGFTPRLLVASFRPYVVLATMSHNIVFAT